MKFLASSVVIFVISLSVIPFIVNTSKISTATDSELAAQVKKYGDFKKIPKYEENAMFDLYAQGKIKGMPLNSILKGGPVYFEGWAKYFHYDNSGKVERPTDFFQNNEYYNQRILRRDRLKKDKYGSFVIPSKFHFFLILTRDSLSFFSSRDNQLQKLVDAAQVNLINPIPKDDRFKGGVQLLGEFDEGFCMQILTTIPTMVDPDYDNFNQSGLNQNWVICFDNQKDRSFLMNTLAQIRIIKQNVKGENMEDMKKFKQKQKESLSKLLHPHPTPHIEHYYGPGKNLNRDGFWVLLQDWSQCTLKCGGGVQYQQWMCQPPLPGGKPCQGMPVRSRPCNIQPCPNVSGISSFAKNKNEQVFKPLIKSLPWSSRLQRYIECEVKETDVLWIKRDVPSKMGFPVKYPGRMVMTNRTIALYEDDTLENNLFSFNLRDAQMGTYDKDSCCLMIQALDKQFRVCGFASDCGTRKDPKFVRNWIHAFNLFSKKCYVDLPRKNWKKHIHDDDVYHGSINVAMEPVHAREHIIRKKMKEQKQMQMEHRVSSAQDLALKAIRKELKLETLVKQEEKMKEKKKIRALIHLKLKEEKKKDCLEQALKEREHQNMKGRENKEAELEIEKIKHDAKKDVAKERLNLRKKLADIKKQGRRRRRMLEQQISVIRSEMAKNLILANKNGDMELCRRGTKDPQKAKEYCDNNFVDNYNKNSECKEADHFCPICCENEFGNLFLYKRDECYKICDDMVKSELSTSGDWIWATK